ncbi:hypothetical protein EVAR_92326_1 [Eumeta japonica]|uniref:DUF5641 domain-containing protein n=1 Tax=Eumeta variegata TaxID=151549 RepID=A0A4C1TJN1_EUMVA|nr:hypothetical protein EVAR_92326_1 [Eumeta japonica]
MEKNLVRACNELSRVLRSSRQFIFEFSANEGIKFNFSPTYAPHFGEHFLIGRPLMSVPSLPVTSSRTTRYELIEKIRQEFWERWHRQFVAELQQRTKWRTQEREIAIGDMVILKEENNPPLQRKLGRVCSLYPVCGLTTSPDTTADSSQPEGDKRMVYAAKNG